MYFSLDLEVIAAGVILLLMIYSRGSRSTDRRRIDWFGLCLLLSMASIIVDILMLWGIGHYGEVPPKAVMVFCDLHYLLCFATVSMLSVYVFYLIFRLQAREEQLQRFIRLNFAAVLVIFALIVYNGFSGCLFSFPEGQFTEGNLNFLWKGMLLAENLIVLISFLLNRKTATRNMRKLMGILPVVIVVLLLTQLLEPRLSMGGIAFAMVELLLYCGFQSSQVGVDFLTGLGNREAFLQETDSWTKKYDRFHVTLMRLTNFDYIHQKFGYQMGEQFIRAVAGFLREDVDCDYVYRLANEEFAVLCEIGEGQSEDSCIDTIAQRFAQPWLVGEGQYKIGVAFSDMIWAGEPWTGLQILTRLEYAMSMNRQREERCVIHFNDEVDRMIQRQRYVIEQLVIATENRSYEVYFQPLYSLKECTFTSAEALVRLTSTDGETIMPGEFIPIAEEVGMIPGISTVVIEKVCRFISQNRDLPIRAYSINLSLREFLDADVEAYLEEMLGKYDVDPSMIKLEITERTLTQEYGRVTEIMNRLRHRGIGFYLDDFGVGYSNFSRMMALPFETVKLDKRLIDKVTGEERNSKIVSSIVNMLFETDYRIVAEGAEDVKTVEKLKQMNIDLIQGFYYARPMAGRDMVTFLGN